MQETTIVFDYYPFASCSCQKKESLVYCFYKHRKQEGILMYGVFKIIVDIAFVVVVAVAVIAAIRKKKKKDGE